MKRRRLSIAAVCTLGAACLMGNAFAEQYAFTDARAHGMGGANAASAHDATAQWHNPAVFGFMNSDTNTVDNTGLSDRVWGWNLLDIGAGYTMTEDMGRYLDILTDVDFDAIANVSTPAQLNDLAAMAAALEGVSEPGNAFYVDSSVGTSVRIGNFAIGARLFTETAAWVDDLDTYNLGMDVLNATDLSNDIEGVAGSDLAYPIGYSAENLTSAQQSLLTGAGLSQASVDYLDYQLGLLLDNGTIQQSDLDNATDLLTDVIDASGIGSLDDNQTAVVARGFALTEIPVSYGYAVNDNLSIGITAKAMYGRVMGTKIWVFDNDNLDDAIESVSDTESDTLTFGIDVGALYRMDHFQFAVVGHNLNAPSFDGYSDTVRVNGADVPIQVPDVDIDPQVTLGAAFIPSDRFLLEVNYELLETGTLLEGYDIQRLSVGGEVDLGLVALRAGAYRNLAEEWQSWVATAGVGVDVSGIRVDVGGAYSLGDTAEYDGEEIPTEARLYASVGLDF